MSFKKHIQEEVGANYSFSTIVNNLVSEELLDSVENYLKVNLFEFIQWYEYQKQAYPERSDEIIVSRYIENLNKK